MSRACAGPEQGSTHRRSDGSWRLTPHLQLERAARIADGINPIAMSYEMLEGTVQGFRSAAQAAGRDPSTLTVMVRVNAPIAGDPLPEDQRPFLGGSPDQIAADLARIEPLGIDHVFFSTGSAPSLDEEVRRLERLQDAAQRRAT